MRLDLPLRLAEARVRAREEKEGRGESDDGSLHIGLVVFGTFKSRWLARLEATLYFHFRFENQGLTGCDRKNLEPGTQGGSREIIWL